MPHLNWLPNEEFSRLATLHPLNQPMLPQAIQFRGYLNEDVERYANLLNTDVNQLDSSPEAIIESAINGNWLTFLFQVGRWGHMIPGPRKAPMKNIYGTVVPYHINQERLNLISSILTDTFSMFINEEPLELIWNQFDALNWTRVIRSKCLHFQARAANIEGSIPVAVDGLMATQWLWTNFKSLVINSLDNYWSRPGYIRNNSYHSYNRYLTAMAVWASLMNINVDNLEVRLFNAFRNGVNGNDLFL